MPSEQNDPEVLKQLLRAKSELEGLINAIVAMHVPEKQPGAMPVGQSKSLFLRVAEALLANGNRPKTTKEICKATGIPRNSLNQVLHRTHKSSFHSEVAPGYTTLKLWSLTDEAARNAGKQLTMRQPTLFAIQGELTGMKAVDCCAAIMAERGNEPMNALTLAREALKRGYRGKARGATEDEILLTTAKSFWAAMSRDRRFWEVRPLVFALRREGDIP